MLIVVVVAVVVGGGTRLVKQKAVFKRHAGRLAGRFFGRTLVASFPSHLLVFFRICAALFSKPKSNS